MVKNEHEIVIDSPAERVFRFVANLETWPHWHGSGQEVEKTTSGPVDVGTTWKVTGRVQGQPMTITIEVIEYEPNSKFGFKTTSGPIQAQQVFSFEPVTGGTRLTTALELANPEHAAPARQQWDNDLLILKEVLESKPQGRPR
ncbi:MAG: SRPBCC family protein [Chloroflexi bacterium]|nr:SRPBCC family protein [Chloroflexota bacterium]